MDIQMDRQLARYMDIQIYRQIDRQIARYLDIQIYRQIDSQISRYMDIQRDLIYSNPSIQIYRYIDRQIDGQMDRQIDSQIDRQIDRCRLTYVLWYRNGDLPPAEDGHLVVDVRHHDGHTRLRHSADLILFEFITINETPGVHKKKR